MKSRSAAISSMYIYVQHLYYFFSLPTRKIQIKKEEGVNWGLKNNKQCITFKGYIFCEFCVAGAFNSANI